MTAARGVEFYSVACRGEAFANRVSTAQVSFLQMLRPYSRTIFSMLRKKRKASQLALRVPLLVWSAPPSVNGWSRSMIYRFADCELDAHLYQLRRNGAPVAAASIIVLSGPPSG